MVEGEEEQMTEYMSYALCLAALLVSIELLWSWRSSNYKAIALMAVALSALAVALKYVTA